MKFLALFLLIPLIEVAVFIKVGGSIGALWTVVLTVGTALIGATLVRMQGLATLLNVRQQLMRGQLPAGAVIEGVMLVVCGAMLLTPGFVTDTIGFLGLIPSVRRSAAQKLMPQINVGAMGGQRPKQGANSEDSNTLEGQWTRED